MPGNQQPSSNRQVINAVGLTLGAIGLVLSTAYGTAQITADTLDNRLALFDAMIKIQDATADLKVERMNRAVERVEALASELQSQTSPNPPANTGDRHDQEAEAETSASPQTQE